MSDELLTSTTTFKETREETLKLPVTVSSKDLFIDWSAGKVVNKSTGDVMSVAEAVQKGYLDSDTVERLAETGLKERPDIDIDWEKGTIKDKATKVIMTIDEAERMSYLDKETANVLKLICGEFEETEVNTKQEGRTTITKLLSDLRKEDEELTSTKTTQIATRAPVISSTPIKKVQSLNEHMRSETFDTATFIESVRTGALNTDESYLVNPKSGQVITLTEAIDTNVFDINTGQIVNTETEQRFSLQEAYTEGFIPPPGQTITRTMQSGFVTNNFQYLDNESDKCIHTAIQTNLKTSLTEPMERPKGMTFREALERGLVDEQAGTFCNPLNGEIISIATAIEYGWISESGETVKIEPDRKYEKTIIVNQRAPSDELKRLSFTQALDQGFIDLGKNQYTEPTTGNRMSILDAIRGQLLATTSEEEAAVTENITLNSALESGAFDEESGLFTDRQTGKKFTLGDAIARGHIDGNSSMYDVENGKVYTLNEAISKGKIDVVSGHYVENSSAKMSLKTAAKKGVIALIGAPYLAIKAATGKRDSAQDSVDMSSLRRKSQPKTSEKVSSVPNIDEPITIEATKFSVLSPTTLEVTQVRELTSVTAKDSDKMNFMEAVSSGYLNPETGMFQHPDTGLYMNLQKALHTGYIHPDSAKLQTGSGKFVNLQEALDMSVIDNTGHSVQDGSIKNLEDMISNGQLQETIPEVHAASSLVMKTTDKINVDSVLDPRNNSLCSLSMALDTGLINPHDGTYTNPKTGEIISILDAVSFGYIQGQVIDSITMKEGLSKEGFNAEVTFSEKKKVKVAAVLDTETGDKLSLHEAIRRGIIDESEGRYRDTKTGQSMAIFDAMDQQYVTASEIDADMVSSENYRKSSENTFTQTKSLDITTVIDPFTREKMSLPTAVERGVLNVEAGIVRNLTTGSEMTISDAIKQGFVKGSQTSRKSGIFSDTLPKRFIHEKETMHLKSVYDQDQGRFIPVKQAIQKGIIDEDSGVYICEDGSTIPISRAIDERLIQVESRKSHAGETGFIQEKKSYTIQTVLDPSTGERINASQAIEKDLLNLTAGMFYNPVNGEKLTIPEAVDRGYVEADTSSYLTSSASVLKPTSVQVDLGRKSFMVKSVLDPRTREEMSVTEAVSQGVLDQSMCKYLDKRTGQTLTLRDAVQKGVVVVEEVKDTPITTEVFIESIAVKSIIDPLTGKEYSLKKAVQKGLFDPERGLVYNRLSDQMISLDDAVKQGLATVEQKTGITDQEIIRGIIVEKVKDPMTGKELGVKEAKRRGILDSDSGLYVDNKTHTKISVEEALKTELIRGRKSSDSGSFEKEKKDNRQVVISQVLDTRTGTEVTLDEAVRRGLIDKSLTTYTDPRTGKSYPIEDAMKEGLVSGTVAVTETSKSKYTSPSSSITYDITSVTNTATGEKLSVTKAMKEGILAPSGMFVDRKTGRVMPVSDAIKEGLVDTEIQEDKKKQHKYDKFYKIVAPGTELQVITFTQALKNNFINGIEGTFTNPFNGDVMSVDEAVLSEILVSDTGKHFKYKTPKRDRVTYTFQQAFKSGLIDPHTGLYWDVKKGKSYEVEEALKKGYLSPLSTPSTDEGSSVVVVKGGLAKPLSISHTVIEHDTEAFPIDKKADIHAKDSTGEGMPLSKAKQIRIDMQENIQVQAFEPENSSEVNFHRTSSPELPVDYAEVSDTRMNDSTASEVPITLKEAITAGLVDRTTGQYIDPCSGDVLSVDEAVICGFLEMDRPEQTFSVNIEENLKSPVSITEALAEGCIDTETGDFTCPTGIRISLQKAIQLGYVQAKLSDEENDDADDEESEMEPKPSVKPKDQYVTVQPGAPFSPKHEKVFKDGKMVARTATEVTISEGSTTYITRPGFFIDSTGKVVNTVTGERMSIQDAMLCGIADIEAAEGSGEVKLVGSHFVPPSLEEVEAESAVRITPINTKSLLCSSMIIVGEGMQAEIVVADVLVMK